MTGSIETTEATATPAGPADTAWARLTRPDELRRAVPATEVSGDTVGRGRSTIRRILRGEDDRLLVIVGPCALQDRETAIDYADRLRQVADTQSDDLFIVMRTYFEKPRTVLGWPGLAIAPDLLGPADPERGFRLVRSLLVAITGMAVPVAVEWLSALGPAYLDDLVSWGSIGARTVESPMHRQLASGLLMPVGMKNRTDGAVDVAVNAVRAAAQGHTVLGVAPDGSISVTTTAGNPDCHVVLRGGTTGPNHHPAAVRNALRLLEGAGLPRRLLIDASHGNSGKDHHRQRVVAAEIGEQISAGGAAVRGILLESFLLEGRQDVTAGSPPARGRSITDACLDWPTTVDVLTELAAATRAGRRARAARAVPRPRAEVVTAPVPVVSPAVRAVALVEAGIFDSYLVYERAGVWTVAGGSQATITLDAERVRVCHPGGEYDRPWRNHPLARLGEALADLPLPAWTAYGWLSFELTHLITGRPGLTGPGDLAHLIVPQAEIHLDATGTTVACADPVLRGQIRTVLAAAVPLPAATPITVDIDRAGEWYRPAIADAVRAIRGGELQKVVLSRGVPVAAELDLPRSYLLGRAANSPARSFLLDLGGHRAAGFCPETILEAGADGVVSTQPLAGTRAFGNGADTDRRLRAELLTDPKEIYEHVVSVKLAHDELQRVCQPSTIAVTELMAVKQRGGVQHLGSRVRGHLAPQRTSWDALEAVFPAVTSSGIPKAAACEYITRTEPEPRGLYSGAVLMAAHDGTLDAGLVLRTVFEKDGRHWLRAGAGIVAASRPEREYEETCEKLRSIALYLTARRMPDR